MAKTKLTPSSLFPILNQHPGPRLLGIARLAAESTHADDGHHIEFRTLQPRTILNRSVSKRQLKHYWTINPFRGCEFGCKYCYARYTHEFLQPAPINTPRPAPSTSPSNPGPSPSSTKSTSKKTPPGSSSRSSATSTPNRRDRHRHSHRPLPTHRTQSRHHPLPPRSLRPPKRSPHRHHHQVLAHHPRHRPPPADRRPQHARHPPHHHHHRRRASPQARTPRPAPRPPLRRPPQALHRRPQRRRPLLPLLPGINDSVASIDAVADRAAATGACFLGAHPSS